MAKSTVTIRGLDKLIRRLNSVQELRWAKTGLEKAARHLKGRVAVYPNKTLANSPSNPTGRWYERGYGTKWVSGGRVRGKRTSETLGKKWTIQSANAGLTRIIGNNVSYGPFVQGDKQARFHKRRNWKTIYQVVDEEEDTVLTIIKTELDKKLNS